VCNLHAVHFALGLFHLSRVSSICVFFVLCARQQWVVFVNRKDRLTTIDRLSLR